MEGGTGASVVRRSDQLDLIFLLPNSDPSPSPFMERGFDFCTSLPRKQCFSFWTRGSQMTVLKTNCEVETNTFIVQQLGPAAAIMI